MSKVIDFPGCNTGSIEVEPDAESVKKCLDLATERDLIEVLVIGRKDDGDMWFSTNNGNAGDMLFLLEACKAIVMQECFKS